MTQNKSPHDMNLEQKTIRALAWMVEQYLRSDDGVLDNMSIHAGELALEALAEHGFVIWVDRARTANWTDEGQRLLNGHE
ncbi:MAG: hypothetical protein AAGK37_07105 [Pseudomonadota bacterium]